MFILFGFHRLEGGNTHDSLRDANSVVRLGMTSRSVPFLFIVPNLKASALPLARDVSLVIAAQRQRSAQDVRWGIEPAAGED